MGMLQVRAAQSQAMVIPQKREPVQSMENGVQFLEDLDDVVGVILAYILDPKVVNDKGESDGLGDVLSERRSFF